MTRIMTDLSLAAAKKFIDDVAALREQVQDLTDRNKKLSEDLEDQRLLTQTRTRERDDARDHRDDALELVEEHRRTLGERTEEVMGLQYHHEARVESITRERDHERKSAEYSLNQADLLWDRVGVLAGEVDRLERLNVTKVIWLVLMGCLAAASVASSILAAVAQ